MEQKSLTADDGVEIFYRRWVPDGEVRAVVLVVHGASEHSARYARFASVLNDEGYAVLAPDLRGHGRTASSTGTGRLGERGMEGVFADLDILADVARAEFSPAPIVLFGHNGRVGRAGVRRTVGRPTRGIRALGVAVSNGAAQVRALEQRLRDARLDVTAHYYADARHELLNETNRDEVHADVTNWLARVLANA